MAGERMAGACLISGRISMTPGSGYNSGLREGRASASISKGRSLRAALGNGQTNCLNGFKAVLKPIFYWGWEYLVRAIISVYLLVYTYWCIHQEFTVVVDSNFTNEVNNRRTFAIISHPDLFLKVSL